MLRQVGGAYVDLINQKYGADFGNRASGQRFQAMQEQQTAREYDRNQQLEQQQGLLQEQRVQDAEALGSAQRAGGAPTSAGQGYAIAQQLESSYGPQGAAAMATLPEPQQPAQTPREAADLQAVQLANAQKRQAIQKNEEAFARNGLSPEKFGEVNMNLRTLTRGLATLDELNSLSRSDVNLLKGGGAAMAQYMRQTLQPAIMEMINTGVINSPSEQDRVDSFLAQVAGWEGLTTWGTTQQAQFSEMTRWFTNQTTDFAASYGIDPVAYADAYSPRSLEEMQAQIDAFDIDKPGTLPDGFTPVGSGIGLGAMVPDVVKEAATSGRIGEYLGRAFSGPGM